MRSLQFRKTIFTIGIILFGFTGVYFTSVRIEQDRPPMPPGYGDQDLVFRGEKLKPFSLGMNGILADWYWMQSLQYLGGKLAERPDIKINVNDLREFEPKLLYPLLDNAVSFDPQFLGVYEYGAVVLPTIDPALAVKIAQKGIANNPKEWRLYNHLGYIYWRNGSYDLAAEAYSNASKLEGAPVLMASMAAKMKTDGGSRETARTIYQQMYESAADTSSKQTVQLQLLKLDSLDEIDAINSVLKSSFPACIGDLRIILPKLSDVQLPGGREFRIDESRNLVDGSGIPYLFNKVECKVQLDTDATKLPID